jgi:hypothetical protein
MAVFPYFIHRGENEIIHFVIPTEKLLTWWIKLKIPGSASSW